MRSEIESMKRKFASQLKNCLSIHYGGRLPSISTIARDFSLKANHLPHVSGETVRKWLRAETIPQYPRVQSLADWLGPTLLLPLENWSHTLKVIHIGQSNNGNLPRSDEVGITTDEAMHIMLLIQKLTKEDFTLIQKLVESLQKNTVQKN